MAANPVGGARFRGEVITLALLGAAMAIAQPGGDNVIDSCVKTRTGAVRIVEGPDDCGASETYISWNQQGEPGQAGASAHEVWQSIPGNENGTVEDVFASLQGEPGPAGADGATGQPGADGVSGASESKCSTTTLSRVHVERRLTEAGHVLRPEAMLPQGVEIPFSWVRVLGNRCHISGHGALDTDGRPEGPFGRVPDQVSPEEAQQSAVSAMLAILGSVQRVIADLDRIVGWTTVSGFVQAEPGYAYTTAVLNPVSDLLVHCFGHVGLHSRTAIGVAALPLNLPVVISAECVFEP